MILIRSINFYMHGAYKCPVYFNFLYKNTLSATPIEPN